MTDTTDNSLSAPDTAADRLAATPSSDDTQTITVHYVGGRDFVLEALADGDYRIGELVSDDTRQVALTQTLFEVNNLFGAAVSYLNYEAVDNDALARSAQYVLRKTRYAAHLSGWKLDETWESAILKNEEEGLDETDEATELPETDEMPTVSL